jgi:hypothetical protein
VVTSRSADCNAGEFQAAGDRNDQLDLNPLAQTNLSESSSLRIANGMSDGNCNMHCTSVSHATQTAVNDLSHTLNRHCSSVYYLTANDVKLLDFSDCSKIHPIFYLRQLDDYLHLKSVPRDLQLTIAIRSITDTLAHSWLI